MDGEQRYYLQRKMATCSYNMFGFLISFEYSAIIISQLFYLKNSAKVEQPEFYYSLITAVSASAAAISGILAGYYIDKTKNMRKGLIFFAALSLTGNLLYTIHHSVWCLLIGRFLCGLSDAAQPTISGEFSRQYRGKELTNVLSIYQGFASIGYIMGPAFFVLSKNVNIKINSWNLDQNNFVGIFLVICYAFYIICIFFALSNVQSDITVDLVTEMPEDQAAVELNLKGKEGQCTRDLDKQKSEIITTLTNENIIATINIGSHQETIFCGKTFEDVEKNLTLSFLPENDNIVLSKSLHLTWKQKFSKLFQKIFFNFDVFLLFLSTGISNYLDISISLLTSMTVSKVLDWSLARISTVSTICIFMFTCTLPIIGKFLKSDRIIYQLYLICLSLPVFSLAMIGVTNAVNISNDVAQVSLITAILLPQISSYILVLIFARKLLFKVVPPELASYYEGIRNSFSRSFGIVAYFSAVLIFPHTVSILPGIIIMVALFVTVLCIRQRSNCWYEQ